MGFADSIRATASKQLAQVDKEIEEIAVELFQTVVFFSPSQPSAQYAKGEFINNWRAALNTEDLSTTDSHSNTGETSKETIKKLHNANTFLRKDGYVTFSNSTSYADLVEYKGWPSSINPRWINNVGPYAPVRNAWAAVVPKYKK